MPLYLQHGAERSVAVPISYLTLTSKSITWSGSAPKTRRWSMNGGGVKF